MAPKLFSAYVTLYIKDLDLAMAKEAIQLFWVTFDYF